MSFTLSWDLVCLASTLSVPRLNISLLEVDFLLYTEAAGMLEGSFSEESTGLVIFLLWGSLLQIQEEGKKNCAKTHDIFHNVSSYKLDFFTPKVSCKFKRQGPPCNSHIDTKHPQINRELNLVAWRMSAMLNLLFVGWQSLIESSLHSFSITVLFPMITI